MDKADIVQYFLLSTNTVKKQNQQCFIPSINASTSLLLFVSMKDLHFTKGGYNYILFWLKGIVHPKIHSLSSHPHASGLLSKQLGMSRLQDTWISLDEHYGGSVLWTK